MEMFKERDDNVYKERDDNVYKYNLFFYTRL